MLKKTIKKIGTFLRKRWVIEAFFICMALGFLVAGILLLWVVTLEIPDLSAFDQRRVQESTKIYDRTGKVLLYDFHTDIRRTVVPFDEISRNAKNATIAIEDDNFYNHYGIDPGAILRAVIVNILTGEYSQGGSTITQQVIKNSLLVQDKTITRKVKEWILAIKLERVISKDEILYHYLNETPYGGTIYGIEEASRSFFGKSANELSLAEAAYLAALPQAPTYYSPYGQHRDALESRKNLVLRQMLKNNFITEEEHDKAREEKVEFLPRAATGIRAPHFVFYIRDYLVERFGENAPEERGLKVISTIDWDLQEKAEQITKENALKNKETFNAENAAIVAMDPKTGQILTMVGSRDYFDEEIDGQFNIALAERQPGSSFKPFVYAEAFRKGYTPDTIVFDLKTQFSTSCSPQDLTSESPCYSPNNYDNIFRGPMSLRNALAQSVNIPAVKVLYLAGIRNAINLARDMGITTLTNPAQYGLTLVLGGGEVRLIDMVGAYSVFANEGMKHPTTGVLRIEDARGNVLEEYEEHSERVLEERVALEISDVLSDNVARTPAFGASSLMFFSGRDVAVKTGTTNDYRDAWILGYTPDLVVGAWAGNNDNRSMEKKVAGFIITPLWRQFMDVALEKYPASVFPEPGADPGPLKPVLAGSWTGVDLTGSSSDASHVGIHDILYFVNKDDPRGPYPTNPASDSQFQYWEYPVQVWAQTVGNATVDQLEEDEDDDESSTRRTNKKNDDD